MKKVTIKNEKFYQQIKGEKVQEMTTVLLLSVNNTIIYDIVCNKNCEQLNDRIKEIDINNIRGISYIAITDKMSFVEYKRILSK